MYRIYFSCCFVTCIVLLFPLLYDYIKDWFLIAVIIAFIPYSSDTVMTLGIENVPVYIKGRRSHNQSPYGEQLPPYLGVSHLQKTSISDADQIERLCKNPHYW
jgi:hypothetical protein